MPEPTTRTILVPTLIETVEQAEALPVGVEVRDPEEWTLVSMWRKDESGIFRSLSGFPRTASELLARGALEALVPVEATVQWGVITDDEGSMDIFDTEAEARRWGERSDGPRFTTIYMVTEETR